MLNQKQMLKQVQKMQQAMEKLQEDLYEEKVESSSGGGAVQVVFNGRQEMLKIKIDPSAVTPDDIEMLEDLVLTAVNEGLKKSQELATNKMCGLTGGLKIPGLF